MWVSGVCDPYQPVEEQYELTRRCVELLVEKSWPVVIQTRSPLADAPRRLVVSPTSRTTNTMLTRPLSDRFALDGAIESALQ